MLSEIDLDDIKVLLEKAGLTVRYGRLEDVPLYPGVYSGYYGVLLSYESMTRQKELNHSVISEVIRLGFLASGSVGQLNSFEAREKAIYAMARLAYEVFEVGDNLSTESGLRRIMAVDYTRSDDLLVKTPVKLVGLDITLAREVD